MTRRFLLGLAFVAAIIRRAPGAATTPGNRASTLVDRLALVNSTFSRPADARRVGFLYLAQTPSENDPELLWSAVFGSTGASDHSKCRSILQERIAHDFRSMNIVKLRGWLFARSEARLCALSCFS